VFQEALGDQVIEVSEQPGEGLHLALNVQRRLAECPICAPCPSASLRFNPILLFRIGPSSAPEMIFPDLALSAGGCTFGHYKYSRRRAELERFVSAWIELSLRLILISPLQEPQVRS
jgi:hypothetical protein